MIDNDLKQAMADLIVGEPTHGVDVHRALAAGRTAQRARRIKMVLSVAAAAVVVGVGVPLASSTLVNQADVVPLVTPTPSPPGLIVDDVPVWYDAKGLHRGDIVEQTPIQVGDVQGEDMSGALALVRSGALYLDPATGDVWFHPWGGAPRIVGRNSGSGPGGDPNGDTAAWFEGRDLVVYDTAAGREISRTNPPYVVVRCGVMCAEHYPSGNTFLQVSASRVAWDGGENAYSLDVSTGTTSVIEAPVVDVHDDAMVLGENDGKPKVLTAPGQAPQRFADLEPRARMSPDGNYVLAVEASDARHGAAIIDTRSGALWRAAGDAYPWIAWSYGDIALVDREDALLACDASRRTCERLPSQRPFLMPTN